MRLDLLPERLEHLGRQVEEPVVDKAVDPVLLRLARVRHVVFEVAHHRAIEDGAADDHGHVVPLDE